MCLFRNRQSLHRLAPPQRILGSNLKGVPLYRRRRRRERCRPCKFFARIETPQPRQGIQTIQPRVCLEDRLLGATVVRLDGAEVGERSRIPPSQT